jgi:hypothetical protein
VARPLTPSNSPCAISAEGTGGVVVVDDREADFRRVVLTRLVWKWLWIAAGFAAVTVLSQWLQPRLMNWGCPAWAVTLSKYAINYSVGFAAGFALFALITAYERSKG